MQQNQLPPEQVYNDIPFIKIAKALLFVEFILPLLVIKDMVIKVWRERREQEHVNTGAN